MLWFLIKFKHSALNDGINRFHLTTKNNSVCSRLKNMPFDQYQVTTDHSYIFISTYENNLGINGNKYD